MDKVETEFLHKELLKPWVWLRYIDGIIFVWTHGEESLQQFLEHLNDFHPGLQFTSEIFAHQVNFLDVIVKLQENEFLTGLYCKKTNCHQYLHYDSCHPEHMKNSSVYSQGLQIKRFCSDSKDCETHLKNLKNWFHSRGYPENIIDNQLKHLKKVSREDLLRPKERGNKNIGIPFIVTYDPHLKHLGKLIQNNIKHLYADVKVRTVFPPAPFASFRTVRSCKI